MNNPRAAISNALLALLTSATKGVITWGQDPARSATLFTQVPAALQPALLLSKLGETPVQDQAYGLTKWDLHYTVMIYARGDVEPGSTSEALFDPITDAIDAAMKNNGEPQTLGNLVVNAWLDGNVRMDPPGIDPQAALMLMIKVQTGI